MGWSLPKRRPERATGMAYRSKTRGILEEALTLARRALPEEALAVFDHGLAEAREGEDSSTVAVLARHAGVISSHVGDLERVVGYYEEAARNQPDDAFLRLALVDVYERLGQWGRARAALAECREIALSMGDEEILAMLRARGSDPDPDK